MRCFHVWFSTKARRPVLVDEIRFFVLETMKEVAAGNGTCILEMQAIEDHVHLLLALRPDQKLATVMHDIKGATARAVFLRYPDLPLDMKSNSLWQKSYGARPVPDDQIETVKQYIRTQEDRPLRHE